MDFRFRDVDLRPPGENGFFTTTQVDLRQRPYSPRSSVTGGGDAGFFSTQAFLARQREKERIREEILAEEFNRRRELEQEVRRELAMERQMAAFQEGCHFPSVLEPRVPLPSLLHINEPRGLERLPLPPLPEPRVINPPPFLREDERFVRAPEQRVMERIHVQTSSGPVPEQRFVKVQPFPDNKKQPINPSMVTVEEKIRKVAAGKKSHPCQWKCNLCNVTCNNETVLVEHRMGKKHLSKQKQLRATTKGGGGGGADTKNLKANKTPVLGKKGDDDDETKIGEAKQKKKQKTEDDTAVEDYNFWCEYCKKGSSSEKVFQSHLIGKKHLLTVMKHKAAAAAAVASSVGTANVEGNDAETVGRDSCS